MSQRRSRSYKQKHSLSAFGQLALPLAALVAVGILVLGVRLFFQPQTPSPDAPPPIQVSQEPSPTEEPEVIEVSPTPTPAPKRKAAATLGVVRIPKAEPEVEAKPTRKPLPTAVRKKTPSAAPTPRLLTTPKPHPTTVQPSRVPPSPGTGAPGFWVQAGAFSSREAAQALTDRLQKEGFRPQMQEAKVGEGTFFRVRVPGGNNREAAEAVAASLGAKGFPTQIVPPRAKPQGE